MESLVADHGLIGAVVAGRTDDHCRFVANALVGLVVPDIGRLRVNRSFGTVEACWTY